MRNLSPTFNKNPSPFKLSLLTLSILTVSACGAGGGSFDADVHYEDGKKNTVNEYKNEHQYNHQKTDNEEEELQTGYAVEIPIRNIGQTKTAYSGGDPVIKAILGDYDQAEHYAAIGKVSPFTNGDLAENAFQTQLQEEGYNGVYEDKQSGNKYLCIINPSLPQCSQSSEKQLREPNYLLDSKKLAFLLKEEFGVANPYDNNDDYDDISGAIDGGGGAFGADASKTHPKHINFFNNIDLGYATVFSRYKDQPKSLEENRSGMGGFVYYRGTNPSQSLPTKDQELEYQGVWAYTTDADLNRYKDLVKDPSAVDNNTKSSNAAGFDGASSGEHGISRGGTSYAEPYTLGHIAKFNINFGQKSFKGDLSVVKGDYRGSEYQYKDKTGQSYLVDNHPNMTKEERRKAATVKRFELEGEIKGNTFKGNAKAVQNKDPFDNYFHDSQDMKGSFFGANGEELAGKFSNKNANGDNSLFVVFGGKRSADSEKLVQGQDDAGKDQEKIMDAFVVGYDLPDSENPVEVAYIRNNLDNFGHKEVLHINGETINLYENKDIVRDDNRYDLDNLIIGRYIAKGGASMRDQFKENPAFEQAKALQEFWNKNIHLEAQDGEDDGEQHAKLTDLSKEEVLAALSSEKTKVEEKMQANQNELEKIMLAMDALEGGMDDMFGDDESYDEEAYDDDSYDSDSEDDSDDYADTDDSDNDDGYAESDSDEELDDSEEMPFGEDFDLDTAIEKIDILTQENEALQTKLTTLEEKQSFIQKIDFENVLKPALNNWISEDSLSDKDKALIQRTITNNFNGGAYFLQGNSTPVKDMPASGTATYQGKWFGRVEKDGRYASPSKTAANFNVDFGNKKLTGELTGDHSRKIFDIRADIRGNQFEGTANTPEEGFNIADSSNSSHSQPIYVHMKDAKVQGGFFGPKAQDLGGSVLYNDATTKTKAVAVFGATKQETKQTQ